MSKYFLTSCVVSLACFVISTTPVTAQDMRVYTTVSNQSRTDAASKAVSHSLTLFHAGKVYDYMEEAGEVVIYEPVHHRFVILGKNYTATEVPFTEVNHAMESTKTEALKIIEQMRQKSGNQPNQLADIVQFQIDPKFESILDPNKKRFDMKANALSYSVKTAQVESPQFVRLYLDYADWAARLNFMLRPNATFPQARLQLNEALRKEELMPTQVDLQLKQAQSGETIRLRAEHQFSWEFQSVDRRHISHWERQLRSNEIRWVTFQEYQQQLFVSRSK
ncbi:hypothetical protein [Planctomicrobium sp. SH527]|uniref:hypothetical protein n=1 Tax=Planctomicrobium sp. SH527 TaxID=3448123 RepID=UPI003F5BAAB2